VRRIVVAVGVIGLCLLGTGTAHAVFPGQNGLIAYGGGARIHTILPSGHDNQAITPLTAADPAWSPNGRRMAFTFDPDGFGVAYDIYTMRADGSDRQRLTFDGDDPVYGYAQDPSYSPGGGRIVFGAIHDRSSNAIVTVRNDGSDRTTVAAGAHVNTPVWSPSGEIAYLLRRSSDERTSIWAMRPDGSDQHHLLDLGKGGGSGPIYAPDGREFLFARVWGDGSRHTLLANADGTGVRKSPCAATLDRMRSLYSYSPDGKWILAGNFDQETGATTLVRVSLASCAVQRVVGHAGGGADWQASPAP